MDIETFMQLLVVGGFVSAVTEWFQKKYGVDGYKAKIFNVFGSLLIGSVYYFLSDTAWWVAVTGALTTSSTVYALFINGVFGKKSEIK
jgi:hypothetical protein